MLVEFVLAVATGPWLVAKYAIKNDSPQQSHNLVFVLSLLAGLALWAVLAGTGALDSLNLGIVHSVGLRAPGYGD